MQAREELVLAAIAGHAHQPLDHEILEVVQRVLQWEDETAGINERHISVGRRMSPKKVGDNNDRNLQFLLPITNRDFQMRETDDSTPLLN